jgi:hypothetical protein
LSALLVCLAVWETGDGGQSFTLQFSIENNWRRENAFIIMVELFAEWCRVRMDVDVGNVLRTLGLICKHQVRIDANFATLVVNYLCVEFGASRLPFALHTCWKTSPRKPTVECVSHQDFKDPKSTSKVKTVQGVVVGHVPVGVNDDQFFRREIITTKRRYTSVTISRFRQSVASERRKAGAVMTRPLVLKISPTSGNNTVRTYL